MYCTLPFGSSVEDPGTFLLSVSNQIPIHLSVQPTLDLAHAQLHLRLFSQAQLHLRIHCAHHLLADVYIRRAGFFVAIGSQTRDTQPRIKSWTKQHFSGTR